MMTTTTKTIRTYRCTDGNGEIDVRATCADDAAQKYVDGGDWGDEPQTQWIDVWVTPLRRGKLVGERERITVTVQPREPPCPAGTHDWTSPHEVVGGCEENPGVVASGGGVKIHEVCAHCDLRRVTDTWAQRPDTGEQGLESISYRAVEA